MSELAKRRGSSEQSKPAGLGSQPPSHRGSRGSRGGGRTVGPEVSGVSAQTPLGGREKSVGGGKGGVNGGMAAGEEATSRVQIPESGICTPSISTESVEERAASHKHATTSWRCGFEWVSALLKSRLRAWDEQEMQDCNCSLNDLYNGPFSWKYMEIRPYAVPHIIGRGGRVIRELEQVCGVFLTLSDLSMGGHELCITGPRPACILVEFAVELLSAGQHSVLRTLSSLRL